MCTSHQQGGPALYVPAFQLTAQVLYQQLERWVGSGWWWVRIDMGWGDEGWWWWRDNLESVLPFLNIFSFNTSSNALFTPATSYPLPHPFIYLSLIYPSTYPHPYLFYHPFTPAHQPLHTLPPPPSIHLPLTQLIPLPTHLPLLPTSLLHPPPSSTHLPPPPTSPFYPLTLTFSLLLLLMALKRAMLRK